MPKDPESKLTAEQNRAKKGIKKRIRVYVVAGLVCLLLIPVGVAIKTDIDNKDYQERAFGDPRSSLHNLYLGCKAYWAEQGSDKECRVDIATRVEYGFVPNPQVSISGQGTESDFTATAKRLDSTTQYTMDAQGNIH